MSAGKQYVVKAYVQRDFYLESVELDGGDDGLHLMWSDKRDDAYVFLSKAGAMRVASLVEGRVVRAKWAE